MAIVTNGGKIITHGSKIGTGEGCCCTPCDPCAAFFGGVARGWVLRGTFFAPGTWVSPASGIGVILNYTAPNGWMPEPSFPEPYWLLIRSEDGALYSCGGPWTPVEGDPKDDTIAANPPPDDGQWYEGVYIDGRVAWYLACEVRPCTLEFQGAGGGVLVIDSFSFLGSPCEEAICCNGNDPVPTLAAPGSCGHSSFVFGGPPGTPQAQCLGACCHDPGTGTECMEPQTLDGCNALSGTWHSGKSCDPDQQLITLSFSSAAFGSGGGGIATAPIGTPGPITGVSITTSGSGYAQVVRVVPSVTASVAGGAGATFTANMASNGGSPQTWRVNSVTIAGAGTGYTDGTAVVFSTGDIEQTAAVATLQTARSQPTLTASVSGGTGATLTPTLASNGGSPETWGVESVAVSGSTSGYTDGASVTFSYGANVTEQAAAVAVIKTARATPTITASVAGGSGASLTVDLSQSPTTPSDTALWHVDSVTVADGGTGYTDGDPVTFTVTDGTEVVAAVGTIDVRPTLDAYVADTDGTAATLTPTLSQSGEYWTVSGVTITAAGTGYEVDQLILFTPTGGSTEVEAGVWLITSVDGSGGITGVSPPDEISSWGGVYDGGVGPIERILISEPGDYYKATTAISRVVVTNGGQYYYDDGVPSGVTVSNGGQYYREEVSVAAVTVTVSQTLPSVGTGASITATVDSDKTSGTFGQVTGLAIASGGTGYVAVRPADDPCNLFP